MILRKYLHDVRSVASEIGFYTPLATHIFGALLGYPAGSRIINKSGDQGIPDIRLHSQEDGSEWIVVEAKLDDHEIRDEQAREVVWRDQVVARGYIGPETFYVILCAPHSLYVCNLDGHAIKRIHLSDEQLEDAQTGETFALADRTFRDLLHDVSYPASMERRQLEAFRAGKLRSGHIPINDKSLAKLQSVFDFAIRELREYCLVYFRQLRGSYEESLAKLSEIDAKLRDIGSGAVKETQRLQYRRRTIRAKNRLAFQLFEDDYDRFKHDQTYAGTQKEEHFEEIFCTNTAYVALSRLFFVRICEDSGLTTHKISNSGLATWRGFVTHIKDQYQDLVEVAFKDVAHFYSSLFESSVFDWFGTGDGNLHLLLERILFRLNAFDFRKIDRDLLGSIYQYFRPRVERRRLGEYYTPEAVVDYILATVGIAADAQIMQKQVLDPACGSFTFGVRTIPILLRAGTQLTATNKIDLIRTCLHGQDINPFSVFLSHLSLLFSILDVYLQAKQENPRYEIERMNVWVRNSLTFGIPEASEMGTLPASEPSEQSTDLRSFDYVVGNPPFVRNERLPGQDREVLSDLYPPDLSQRNTDLAVYFLYAAARNFLKPQAKLGMVAPIGVANTQMAAYVRNVLGEYEIEELVSLEWCAKELFPGADIVPMLIFVRKRARAANHRIRLVTGVSAMSQLVEFVRVPHSKKLRASEISFADWVKLSPYGDWCIEITDSDMPIIQKLNAKPRLKERDWARCSFAVKAGTEPKFIHSAANEHKKGDRVPFVKGQHVSAFNITADVDELADLSQIETATDPSIWGDLDFYRENRNKEASDGLGRTDYRVSGRLATGTPSDTLCCLIPEIYVTLIASVADPLQMVANNSVMVVTPKKFSAHCLNAILNSRICRYYAFLVLRSSILLRRRTTWFPRAVNALPMPDVTEKMAKELHQLSVEATLLSATTQDNEIDLYISAIKDVSALKKAAFLGLTATFPDRLGRQELATCAVSGASLQIDDSEIRANSSEVAALARLGLLASDQDDFAPEDFHNVLIPAEESVREGILKQVRNLEKDLERARRKMDDILERVDDIVASGLGLTSAEHELIKKRCGEFPLSVTVGQPRFTWSADRKRQARRTYQAGERFR